MNLFSKIAMLGLCMMFMAGFASAQGKNFQGTLNINTATAEELTQIPGIGQSKASQIVAYRAQTPFTKTEDLLNVNGIGPKLLEKIRPFVVFDNKAPTSTVASASIPQPKAATAAK